MSNPRTTFEVVADIKDIQSKMAVVDKTIEETSSKAVLNSQKMGAGFTAAGKQSAAGTTMMANGSKQASYALTNLNWLVSDSPYLFQNMRMGIMSVSNNINPLMNGFVLLKKEVGSSKAVFKALGSQLTGPAGIATALTVVIAIIQVMSIVMAKHKAKTEASTESNKEFAKSLEQIGKATSIDALTSQIDNSIKLTQATDQLIKDKETQIDLSKKEIEVTNDKQKKLRDEIKLENDILKVLQTDRTRTKSKDEEELLEHRIKQHEKLISQKNVMMSKLVSEKDKQKDILKEKEKEITSAKSLNKQQAKLQKELNERIKLLQEAGLESEKEENLREKLLEIQTARLPIEEQIAVWEAEKAKITGNTTDDKEKILDIDRKLFTLNSQKVKLEAEIAELTAGQIDNDEKIALYKARQAELDQSKLEDLKEYKTLEAEINKIQDASSKAREEAEKKYKLLISDVDTESKKFLQNKISDIQAQIDAEEDGTERRKELETDLYNFKIDLWEKEKDLKEEQQRAEEQYQKDLAGLIAQGDLESIYEDMFSNIKQQILEYWLGRLGVTKAMMAMEQAIIMLGEGNIQGIRNMFHRKEMQNQAEETAGAAVGAGVKGTESAAGLPFPGNIAAIGLVLASVFSAIRKSKTTGTSIVAAAQGAIISKPTLVLAGEALNQSGTEIVMPEKNFNRYMEKDIIPGIMAKVNVDNSGLRAELQQVKSAILTIGKQIPGETGKAVTRALRGKF